MRDLIAALAAQHSDLTYEHFNNVLKTIVSKDLVGLTSLKSSQAAVIALGWSIQLATHAKRDTHVGKNEFMRLIEYQATFYQFGICGGNEKVSDRAEQLITTYWLQCDDIELVYFDRLLALEPAANIIVLLSAVLRFRAQRRGDIALIAQHKEKLIEHFIKGLVTVKVKPQMVAITSCSQLLKTLSLDECKKSILPALQRSMLRSPEIVLQAVGAIVHELDIDVSEFAFDLGKVLIQNLYSKDELARVEAVESLRELAQKCSDAKAIEALAKHAFGVFNGADGKITVAEYRINILQVGVTHPNCLQPSHF